MSTPHYSPDGLTYADITALQREVTAELRREGHIPWPRRNRRRGADSRPRDARTQAAPASRPPAARHDQRHGEHQ
ncbi:hypothetical protein HFP15_39905 [Amycolatopsis sp. K13G38]|uniref:Uncharacterized protein n=1 Tax=Amycolatopsis acididurans TaxID=2724524 RepID=A0ABX1JGU7_9PSEU|nr:hypothetical protein [Amycolatopsis acididurans]NKQ59025.1 hypothetical protein [Amycolatopsis acididurans]